MKHRTLVLLAAAVIGVVAAALIIAGDKPLYTMVNVGGTKNHCECTSRLER